MIGVKHTPVDLHAVFNGLYWDVAVGPHDYSQRVASCHANRAIGHSLEDAERHARLFAAAPDLLEALEGCIPQLELGNGEAEHIKTARAAIARARGEQDGGGE